jgi:hypothetical protein
MIYSPVDNSIYFGATDDVTGTYCSYSPSNDEFHLNRTTPALHDAAGLAFSPTTRSIYIVAGGGTYPWSGFTQNQPPCGSRTRWVIFGLSDSERTLIRTP